MAVIPIQQAAVASGRMPAPTRCSICGTSAGREAANPVWLHDEDYADPLAAYAICRRCHRLLHRRFDEPAEWLGLIRQHGTGARWFEQLTLDPASLRQPFGQTYPHGLPPADQ